jgi:hypothetical protein
MADKKPTLQFDIGEDVFNETQETVGNASKVMADFDPHRHVGGGEALSQLPASNAKSRRYE